MYQNNTSSISFFQNRILRHITFWIVYWFSWVLLDVMGGAPFNLASYRYFGCFVEIPFYYLHMYYLWPKLIKQRRYFSYFISFIIILIISAILVRLYEYYIMFPILMERTNLPDGHFTVHRVLGMARAILLWFGPPTAIKIFRDWSANKVNLEKAKKEQKASELNFLKSQMNPHFLFNTLNNLYALALKGSQKTPDALLQLSNLLSYTLYESTEDKVSLEKEIHHLNNYIELEKLRFGNRLNVQLAILGDMKDVKVPPLILVPMVENAFKHCSLNERGSVDIQIKIAFRNGTLHISTINPVAQTAVKEDNKNGIGVNNILKRLQILYPQKHMFKMEKRNQKFHADLDIELLD
ncbi:histidine kinase [Fulvivirgaceae bacterium BMA10]|uniref:Histidine kinase n=1 Tax=Splendidivirga corallicola TaxID=3051826 RepID=A0ABT8KW82_9BACT|nr:histidine kinase [Fulvivirgaceae bacterium BMA10]